MNTPSFTTMYKQRQFLTRNTNTDPETDKQKL